LVIWITPVRGHPPAKIDMHFDLTAKVLSVSASHAVSDSTRHYVDRVVVKLNGDEIIEQEFRSQSDNHVQIVEYMIIDAKVGDEIEVTAGCNISGRIKRTLVVEEQIGQEPEQDDVN
jgi:hypothetical protein